MSARTTAIVVQTIGVLCALGGLAGGIFTKQPWMICVNAVTLPVNLFLLYLWVVVAK